MAAISDFATIFDCTIWEFTSDADFYGNKGFKAPVYLPKSIWYGATNETFKDANGQEQTAKYEIQCPARNSALMRPLSYIALGGDFTQYLNPVDAGAHEIRASTVIKVPFVGLEDEYTVWV